MSILEQEKKLGVVPRLEVENQLSSEAHFEKYQVIFGPELTAAVISRLKGIKEKIYFPDPVTGEPRIEERELVGIDPGTTFQVLLDSDSVELFSQHLIYRNAQGEESRVFWTLSTNNFDTDEKRRKAQRPEIAELLDLFATVMEGNFEPGKTDQLELTTKGIRHLAEVLKQEDWKGNYLFEFLRVQKKAPIFAADLGG